MPDEERPGGSESVGALFALSTELARLEDVLDGLPAAWYVADAEDRVQLAGPQFEALVDAPRYRGLPVATLYKDASERARLVASASASADAEADAIVTLTTGVQVEDRVRVIGHGDARRVVGVMRDVTAEVEVERALDRAAREAGAMNRALRSHVRALDVLTYGIGHDLRTPLRGIRARADALREDLERALGDVPADVRAHVDAIDNSARDMKRMLTGLLAFAHLRGGAHGRTDAGDVLDEVLRALETQVQEKGVVVDADRLPVVRASPEYLRVVLQNLVGNAVKYARGDPPHVRVTATRHGDEWEVTVADSGKGIPKELQERVFDVFYRVPGSASEGSGVGLAVARVATESWGGRIWVDDARQGGAAFHFTVTDADGEVPDA